MFERLLSRVESWANERHAFTALALVAFTESSFFPIPPYVLVFAMLIHEKRPSWVKVASVGTLASVCGGLFGYVIGKFFYLTIGAPLISFYGLAPEVASIGKIFNEHIFLTILLASLTPIPYKVFTISAGIFSAPILPFMAASLIGRGIRFFTVAFLTHRYGAQAKRLMIEQRKALYVTMILLLMLTIGYVVFLR